MFRLYEAIKKTLYYRQMSVAIPYLQAPYYYGTRTNFPYPPPPNRIPIGYGGSFGTGTYALGGGYYGGQSYLTRPVSEADLYLQANGWTRRGIERLGAFEGFQGYPYYQNESVLGQMRPEYWIAQRRAFESLEPVKIPLVDNRPSGW